MAGGRAPALTARKGLAAWQLELASRRLVSDLSADFPVVQLARLCGLSRSYFARAFKASTGLPPHRWLMHFRIERAKEMLEHDEDSISAIAVSCGFSDQSHLTRVFHAIVGASPAAWRRRRKAGA
jgi:transcriptional regulator GlxA family with amidase domain